MKCYRKNGSDEAFGDPRGAVQGPSMKCYRKNGSDTAWPALPASAPSLNEVLPKER